VSFVAKLLVLLSGHALILVIPYKGSKADYFSFFMYIYAPMVRLYFIIGILSCSQSFGQSFARKDSLRGTLTKFRTCYDVQFYDLSVNINLVNKTIAGSNTIYFKTVTPFQELQVDLFSRMTIDSIVYRGHQLNYQREFNAVFIKFDSLQSVEQGHLKVYYHGKPIEALKPPWDGGLVWSTTSLGRPWAAVSCEGKGASLWWPCKDHPSDEPDSMRISIQIPSKYVEMGDSVISNGVRKNVQVLGNGYTSFVWEVHYPINSYNATYYIGSYVNVKDRLNNLNIDYYIADTKLSKAVPHLEQAKEMLVCFEKLFGPYPFPKDGYALVEAPYWGMEHQGAIAYGNGYTNNVWGFDFIIVHESAHEWWGNSVSCVDHAELWIHESFATYAEALFVEDKWGNGKMLEYLAEQKKRIKNTEPIVGPLGVNYNNWQDTDEYFKGSLMLHTLRNVVDNDSLWFKIIKNLAISYKYKIVTTKEVIDYFSKSLNTDLNPFFEQYLYKTGIPVLEYYWKTDKKGVLNLFYRLKSDISNLKIPIKAGSNNKYTYKLLAEPAWKKAYIKEGKVGFTWAEELFYVTPKEVGAQ